MWFIIGLIGVLVGPLVPLVFAVNFNLANTVKGTRKFYVSPFLLFFITIVIVFLVAPRGYSGSENAPLQNSILELMLFIGYSPIWTLLFILNLIRIPMIALPSKSYFNLDIGLYLLIALLWLLFLVWLFITTPSEMISFSEAVEVFLYINPCISLFSSIFLSSDRFLRLPAPKLYFLILLAVILSFLLGVYTIINLNDSRSQDFEYQSYKQNSIYVLRIDIMEETF